MCGGGGTNSTVTSTTTTLPEWVQPYQEEILARAQAQSALPYQTYQGPRIAEASPIQQEAMYRMWEASQSGDQQGLMDAMNMTYNAGNTQLGDVNTNLSSWYMPSDMSGVSDYQSQSRDSQYNPNSYASRYRADQRDMGFEAGQLNDQAMLDSYMSPYMQSVVEIQKREAMRDADRRHRDLGLSAAQAGQRDSYGQAILAAETERDLGQRLDDLQAEGQQAAFMNAQQAYEADRAARARAEEFGQSQFNLNNQMRQMEEQLRLAGYSADEASKQAAEQFAQGQFGLNMQDRQFGSQQELNKWQAYESAKQAAQQFGLTAEQANQAAQLAIQGNQLGLMQNQLGAAGQLAGLSGQQWADQMERLGIMQGIGAQQTQQAQKQLDTAYNDFMRQQSYPWEQLNMYNSILHGGSITPGSLSTMYGPAAGGTENALAAGLAALAMGQGKGGGS